MKLKQIRLRQFRQFRDGLAIDDLLPGINVFHGPNESGKSTVVQGVRAAFFERYSTGSLTDLLPWGDTSAAPEVGLEFEFKGRTYRLNKRFLRQRRCDLSIDGQNLNGDEAEQHLSRLMGFTVPQRGASRPEHWGVPGLLWIEQGSGQELRPSVSHANEHIQGILNEAMGHVASSEGDHILQKVNERLARLLTRNTGAPTQEYKKARDEQQRLHEELAQLDSAIHDYRRQVDQLAALQREQARDAHEQPWVRLRQQEAAARQQLSEVQTIQAEQKRERDALEVCQQTQLLLHQQLQGFRRQHEALQERERAWLRAQEHHQALSDQTTVLRQALHNAQLAHAQARKRLVASRQEQQRRDKLETLSQLQREVANLRNHYEQASQVQTQLAEQHARAKALYVDTDALARLKTLHEQLQVLRIRQQAVATRLQFDLDPGQSVVIGDRTVQGQTEHLLLSEATLNLPGVGRIHITPGGDDITRLARQYEQLQDDWQACLQGMGVGSLDDAQTRAAQHNELMAALRQHQAVLKLHAPEGLDALRLRLDELTTRLSVIQDECEALRAPSELDVDDLAAAQIREQDAERQLKDAEAHLQSHLVATATAHAAMEAAQGEVEQARKAVQDGERSAGEHETLKRLDQERARQRALEENIAEYQVRIDAVRPDLLEQDILRYGQSAASLQEASAERERLIRELKGRLQGLGAQGLEEQRSELAGRLAVIDRRVQEFARNAAALSLLQRLLQEQRQALTRQLQAPLRQRLTHYLDVLFDGDAAEADVVFDDGLAPSTLTRDNSRAELHELSFGAREQLGLISRLAYADLLKEAGRPTLIMLDDALVHSDDVRLTQMKRILFDAAQRHQILLFTCHPDKWRDLAVTPRAMEDLKASSERLSAFNL